MKSTKTGQVFAVVCTLIVSTLSLAANRDYQTGKLVNVHYDDVLHGASSQRYPVYEVRLGDLIYSAEGSKVRGHKADPARGLVVGDPVRVAIEGERLFLRDSNGKEIKLSIIKRQRAQGMLARWFSR